MPQYPNRQFLDLNNPSGNCTNRSKKINDSLKNSKVDYKSIIQQLEDAIIEKKEITERLTPWQRVQLSRHPDRPYTLKYIDKMSTNFVELHGDRNVKTTKAMVGGFASLDGQTVMFIGQQRASTQRPGKCAISVWPIEGYRKALRLMKLAENSASLLLL